MMSTLQRVLVALDEGHSADGAFALALDLNRNFRTELVLCTALDRAAVTAAAVTPDGAVANVQSILADCDAAAHGFLQTAVDAASAASASASSELLDGRPGPAIVEAANEMRADAIVMGTHGKTGLERIMLGSTAEAVLRMTSVPTFVVHAAPSSATPIMCDFERILVAVDDSEPADAAMVFATDLAREKGSTLLFCNVVDSADITDRALSYGYDPRPLLQSLRAGAAELLAAKSAPAAADGLRVERIVVEGDAPAALLAAAVEHAADLIVVGTHGRRGLRRLFIGSMAESIVRQSTLPVAVVRGRQRTPA